MEAPFTYALSRLARARSSVEGRRLARRTLILALLAMLFLALVHRMLFAVPGIDAIAGRWIWAPLAIFGVAAAAWLLGRAAGFALRFDLRRAARDLDEKKGLHDAADTALSVERRDVDGPLASLAVARASAAADDATAHVATLWPARTRGRRVPIALGVVVLLLLLLPGVMGIGFSRGAGAGTEIGGGTRPQPADPDSPGGLTPEDADLWLEKHATLELLVPDPKGAPLTWRARLTTDAPFPAAYRGELTVGIDEAGPFGPCGSIEVPEGAKGNDVVNFAPLDFEGARAALTVGKHKAFARLAPTVEPWKRVLVSPTIEVIVPPEDPNAGGGGASKPPPQPQPQPKPEPKPKPQPKAPPPPPSTPPPPQPSKGERKPPEVQLHDEVVTPLSREGEKVKKDQALVAVKDPDAGLSAPKTVPLSEALRDYEHVVERAVLGERVLPSDREFLKRYLEALRKAAGLDRAPGTAPGAGK